MINQSDFNKAKSVASKYGVNPVKKAAGAVKGAAKSVVKKAQSCKKVCKKKVWGKCVVFYYKCW